MFISLTLTKQWWQKWQFRSKFQRSSWKFWRRWNKKYEDRGTHWVHYNLHIGGVLVKQRGIRSIRRARTHGDENLRKSGYTLLMYFISNLFQRNWRLPLEGNLWEQETWISYTGPQKMRQNTTNVKFGSNYWSTKSLQFVLSKKTQHVWMYVRNIITLLHYLSNFNQRWKDFGFSFGRPGRIRSIITHPLH